MSTIRVAALMLTYNAPKYVLESIQGVHGKTNTEGIDLKLIVVDNHSRRITRLLVRLLKSIGWIDTLYLNRENSLFAGGNNIAAKLVDDQVDYFLLINSDIRINDRDWLQKLVSIHKRGVTAFGVASGPDRADGYCYLIDADLYRKYPLDEQYQWWWGITKQQALVLKDHSVQAVRHHEKWLHHYGGKSGHGFKDAKGMDIERKLVEGWYKKKQPTIIDSVA